MAARDELLEFMRRNPRENWRIDDLHTVARQRGIGWCAPGGSHVFFVSQSAGVLSVPARRPIKPAYVRMPVEMIDRVRSENP